MPKHKHLGDNKMKAFKRIIWCLIFASSFAFGQIVPIHTHSGDDQGGGTLGPLTGALTSTKPCATGYTRFGPNLCMFAFGVPSWQGINLSCTNIPGNGTLVSANPTAILLDVILTVFSSGVINTLNNAGMNVYNDSTCTTSINTVTASQKEFAAITAGTIIGSSSSMLIVPAVSGEARLIATVQNTASVRVIGYFD